MRADRRTHLGGMKLSVHTPDELIAAIPHLLGFKPEESIVILPMGSDLPVARVDLPTTARDRNNVWESIRDVFSRYAQPRTGVGIICLTADLQVAESIAKDFATRFASIGIDTRVALWADDNHWRDLASGVGGAQTQEARSRVSTMTVLAGRAQPATSRESLATSLVGDREPIASLMPKARDAAAASTSKAEGRWALHRLQQFHADGVRPTDRDAARLLLAMDSIPNRDGLWNDMRRDNVASHVALWTDMTRRAPDEVRAAPASMLGFASWLSGHGAMAWCALDQVPEDRPHALAELVASAVRGGMHPREWEAANSRPTERGLEAAADSIARRSATQAGPAQPAHGF